MTEGNLPSKLLNALNGADGKDLVSIKKGIGETGPVLPMLLWLNSMNFVQREEQTTKHPLIRAKWKITSAGKTYLAFLKTSNEITPFSSPSVQILLVAPDPLRSQLRGIAVLDLYEAIVDLLASAKEELLISSPYIDQTLLPLLRNVRNSVALKILTEDATNPLFRRLAKTREKTEVRYLRVMNKNVQLYQIHAKFICIDRSSAIITSANINERSMNYNVELGVLITEMSMCVEIARLFDAIFDQAKEI